MRKFLEAVLLGTPEQKEQILSKLPESWGLFSNPIPVREIEQQPQKIGIREELPDWAKRREPRESYPQPFPQPTPQPFPPRTPYPRAPRIEEIYFPEIFPPKQEKTPPIMHFNGMGHTQAPHMSWFGKSKQNPDNNQGGFVLEGGISIDVPKEEPPAPQPQPKPEPQPTPQPKPAPTPAPQPVPQPFPLPQPNAENDNRFYEILDAVLRTAAPEGVADYFLGSQADKTFSKRFETVVPPTYQELQTAFEAKRIDAPTMAKLADVRNKYDIVNAERELRNLRNRNIGIGAAQVATSVMPGIGTAKAAATLANAGANVGRAALQAGMNLATNGAISGATYGVLEAAIDPTRNMLQNVLRHAGTGAVMAPVLGVPGMYAQRVLNPATLGAFGKNVQTQLQSAVNNRHVPVPEQVSQQSIQEMLLLGKNNGADVVNAQYPSALRFKPGTTMNASEFFAQHPDLQKVQHFFADVMDVKIEFKSLPNQVNTNGVFFGKRNKLCINLEARAIKKSPLHTYSTLFHELTHAKQERMYNYYSKMLSKTKNLTVAFKEKANTYISNYNSTRNANNKYVNFMRKYKREMSQITNVLTRYRNIRIAENILKRTNQIRLLKIYNIYKKLYSRYKNAPGEVQARKNSEFIMKQLGYFRRFPE